MQPPNPLIRERLIEDAHDGVVKTVRWRGAGPQVVFASAGNDLAIRVRARAPIPIDRPGIASGPRALLYPCLPDASTAPAQIFDTRSPGPAASACVPDAHPLVINSVRWHPSEETLLVSSSFDAALRVHDLRQPSRPLCVLEGHVSPSEPRSKSIYHPLVVSDRCVERRDLA